MKKRLEVITIILTMVGILVAIGAWLYPVSQGAPSRDAGVRRNVLSGFDQLKEAALPTAVLSVTATGARVELRLGDDGRRYAGGYISETGGESVVYLPVGQRLNVEISGTGSIVAVQSELMPYLQMRNTGTGNKVIEF